MRILPAALALTCLMTGLAAPLVLPVSGSAGPADPAIPVCLEPRQEEFDACIIGSSAAWPTEELSRLSGLHFCNLTVQSRNPRDFERCAEFAVEQLGVRHLLLTLSAADTGLSDSAPVLRTMRRTGASSDVPQPARPDDAAMNRLLAAFRSDMPMDPADFPVSDAGWQIRRQDVEKIGDMDFYLRGHAEDFVPRTAKMERWQQCVESVASVRSLCRDRQISLTVVCAPIYEAQWQRFPPADMIEFKTALARVTNYWDFSHSSLSADCRFFYDGTHARPAAYSMMLARIFGTEGRYVPSDFGSYVFPAVARQTAMRMQTVTVPKQASACTVPVLMYHHFEARGNNSAILRADTLARQLQLIADSGYHAVTCAQLLDFVLRGIPLPENPVCITIDDGYRSNYEIAWPLLQENGLKATVFAIGSSVGRLTYKQTGVPILPHFSWDEAAEMERSGVIEIQCHTNDMHQSQILEPRNPCRSCACPLRDETEPEFLAALQQDLAAFRRCYHARLRTPLIALAYPTGRYTPLTEVLVHASGIPITFSTATDRPNVLVKGLPQSLYALCRLNVTDLVTDEQLLRYLSGDWDHSPS